VAASIGHVLRLKWAYLGKKLVLVSLIQQFLQHLLRHESDGQSLFASGTRV